MRVTTRTRPPAQATTRHQHDAPPGHPTAHTAKGGKRPPLVTRMGLYAPTTRTPPPPPSARPPRSAPRGPSLCACTRACQHTMRTPPTLPLALHAAAGQRTPHCMGRDNVVPPHYRHPAPKGASHTPTAPTPEREHQKPTPPEGSEREGAAGPHCPTTPKRTHTSKHANTHANTPRKRKHQTPATHRANTPTTSPSCHPHANTRAPTPNVWAHQV